MGNFDASLDPAHFGIFSDSDALGQVSEMKIESDPNDNALIKTRACEICSRQLSCHMTWAELYCLQYGIFPQQVGQMMRRPDIFPTKWLYNQKFRCFHPEYRCGCDPRAVVIFDMSPSEAKRQFELAANNGQVSPQQQQIINAVTPTISHVLSQRAVPQGMIRG